MHKVKTGFARLVKLTGASSIVRAFGLLLSSPCEFEPVCYFGFVIGVVGGAGLLRLKLGGATHPPPAV